MVHPRQGSSGTPPEGRNPFLNQVIFEPGPDEVKIGDLRRIGRNPFLNQVIFERKKTPDRPTGLGASRNPFLNQVIFEKEDKSDR